MLTLKEAHLQHSYKSVMTLERQSVMELELVDQQLGDHQWETNSPGTTTDGNRIRRLEHRLGSLLEQPEDRSFQKSQLHINAKELLAAFLYSPPDLIIFQQIMQILSSGSLCFQNISSTSEV